MAFSFFQMAPAPGILQSPTVFATVRRDEVGTAATSLELGLITAALLVSIVLSFFNTRRPTLARQPRNLAYSSFVIAVAACFTLCAFGIAIAALYLGWRRYISLDAVAGIVFALAPAFFSIPVEIFHFSRDGVTSRLMWSHVSLKIPTTHFQYIRFMKVGDTRDRRLCSSNYLMPDTGAEDDSKLRQFGSGNLLFMRHMLNSSQHGAGSSLFDKFWNFAKYPMSNERTRYVSRLPRLTKRQRLSREKLHTVKGIPVYGIPIKIFPNFAFVRDVDDGITSWWWSGVSSARHLITRPHRVHLESGMRVGNALALLSDIISIGDLVLYFHLDTLKWMLQNDHDVRTAVISAPGLTCRLFIKELELDGWDAIGPEDLLPSSSSEHILERTDGSENSDGTESLDRSKSSAASSWQTTFSLSRSKHYSLLFLILTETSRRFLLPAADENDEMPSGQKALDELWARRESSTDEFYNVASESVARWLWGWGLKTAVVKEARDRSLTSSNQKDRQSSCIC